MHHLLIKIIINHTCIFFEMVIIDSIWLAPSSHTTTHRKRSVVWKKNGSWFFGGVTSQSLIFAFFHSCRLGLTSSVLKQFLLFTNGSKIRMKQVWWKSFKLNKYIGSRLLTGTKFSRVLLDGAYSWSVDHLETPIAILHQEWCGYPQLCLSSPICCHYM